MNVVSGNVSITGSELGLFPIKLLRVGSKSTQVGIELCATMNREDTHYMVRWQMLKKKSFVIQ